MNRSIQSFKRAASNGLHGSCHWLARLSVVAIILLTLAPASFAKKGIEGEGIDQESQDQFEELQDTVPPTNHHSSNTATIRGSVFYNDMREHGRFSARRDKQQQEAEQCSQDRCNPNWVGGHYMTIDVVERDKGFSITHLKCKQEDILTSVVVDRLGHFTAKFSTDDHCKSDDLADTAIELRVRLRYCGKTFCVSVNEKKGKPYTVVPVSASASNPLTVKPGDDIQLDPIHFNTSPDASISNIYANAANHYASAIDAIVLLHEDHGIPFYKKEFGEVEIFFPENKSQYNDGGGDKSGTATTFSTGEIVISDYEGSNWTDGRAAAHEYAHVVNLRTWDGSYGPDLVGEGAGEGEKADSRQIAFKEGWAKFIEHAVFDGDEDDKNCADIDDNKYCSDDLDYIEDIEADIRQLTADLQVQQTALEIADSLENKLIATREKQKIEDLLSQKRAELLSCASSSSPTDLGPLGEGAQWRDNVVKSLCDWLDTDSDDDVNLAGDGDHYSEDLYSIWYNLRRMYVDANGYGAEFENPGLWFCDFVRYKIEYQKAESKVGQALHLRHEQAIKDLIYNNNIGCFMSAP